MEARLSTLHSSAVKEAEEAIVTAAAAHRDPDELCFPSCFSANVPVLNKWKTCRLDAAQGPEERHKVCSPC